MAPDLREFLEPLDIDAETVQSLSRELSETFRQLALESSEQFLPTPITEPILRPPAGVEKGRYLAIDIGGTNLRVGFIELHGKDTTQVVNGVRLANEDPSTAQPTKERLTRRLEQSWPILEHLKSQNAENLFKWIGGRIASVVQEGCEEFDIPTSEALPLGVTFSFPMEQDTISDATLMSMGKGFAITSNLELGSSLVHGYEAVKPPGLPQLRVAAIANDAVSTLVSFVYREDENERHRAAMGLICGTGSNATIPLRISSLGHQKLPKQVQGVGSVPSAADVKIAVNTEWSINGTLPPLRRHGLINRWDERLDAEGELPGFQPLEYMTAGRYLGELGRLILVEYLQTRLGVAESLLPEKLRQRFGLRTTFLSQFRPLYPPALLARLVQEFPTPSDAAFQWTEELATVVYTIAKAIALRAAGIIAASIVGLLTFAGEIPSRGSGPEDPNGQGQTNGHDLPTDLVVGYTGGCIAHFQDYLDRCQEFLDGIISGHFGAQPPVRVVLSPCHDGGITGAGILCGATLGTPESVDRDEI